MKWIKALKRKWKADTPLAAKRIRNVSYVIASSLPTGWAMAKGMNDIILPPWLGISVFVLVLICGTIGTWAGLKEIKKEDFQ